jgi:hypothetical protein
MGGNDRHTRTLSPEEIARLKQESARRDSAPAIAAPAVAAPASSDLESTEPISWDDLAVPRDDEPPDDRLVLTEPRTTTLQDPLTAALLAEVTREARTQEFDPQELARTLAQAETAEIHDKPPRELAHPKLKRR